MLGWMQGRVLERVLELMLERMRMRMRWLKTGQLPPAQSPEYSPPSPQAHSPTQPPP
jgi:hypothetical protein